MQILENLIASDRWRTSSSDQYKRMAAVDQVSAYLTHCPAHSATPLHDLPDLAAQANIGRLTVKDETNRMGLGSFKALGGAYAVFEYLMSETTRQTGARPLANANVTQLLASAARGKILCCASAGNHGLSVAAGAKLFGAACTIFLAESVPEVFAERLHRHGAEIIRKGATYDDTMEAARAAADKPGWVLISDGSWPGYIDVPCDVMKGYAVITDEAAQECIASGDWPTHVILQAGVGGLAGALANHIRLTWPQQPIIIVVEPENAACLMASIHKGRMTRVDAPGTNMGRLDCAEPSLVAYEILKNTADFFITISDQSATEAANALARADIATTPSGAAGYAGLSYAVADEARKATLKLDDNAHCLVIATEGPLS